MRVGILIALFSCAAFAQPANWEAMIEPGADGRFTLDPALFDDVAWMATQGRVVPNYTGGVFQGFALKGLRSGGLWSRLGLQNGDLVRAANGVVLSSPRKALEVYQTAAKTGVVLDIERAGQPMRLTIAIKGAAPPAAPPSLAPRSAPPSVPARKAPGPANFSGRVQARLDLEFGEAPGDVRGRIEVSTRHLKGRPPGGRAGLPMPLFDLGKVDLHVDVMPGPRAAVATVSRFNVDGADLTVRTDPESRIRFRPDQGLAGHLDLTMTVTPGAGPGAAALKLVRGGAPFVVRCTGPVSQPRCRVDRSAPTNKSSPKSP